MQARCAGSERATGNQVFRSGEAGWRAEPQATGAERLLIHTSQIRGFGTQRQENLGLYPLAEYQKPESEPGTDKRMLLAFVLIFILLGIVQFFIPKPQAPQPDKNQQNQNQPQPPGSVPLPAASSSPTP